MKYEHSPLSFYTFRTDSHSTNPERKFSSLDGEQMARWLGKNKEYVVSGFTGRKIKKIGLDFFVTVNTRTSTITPVHFFTPLVFRIGPRAKRSFHLSPLKPEPPRWRSVRLVWLPGSMPRTVCIDSRLNNDLPACNISVWWDQTLASPSTSPFLGFCRLCLTFHLVPH